MCFHRNFKFENFDLIWCTYIFCLMSLYERPWSAGYSRMIRNDLLNSKYCRSEGACKLWLGREDCGGYGQKRVRPESGDKPKITRTHRLMYFVTHRIRLKPWQHVSHLCGRKLCLNVQHMNLETSGINNSRKACHNDGFCYGHENEPDCVIV